MTCIGGGGGGRTFCWHLFGFVLPIFVGWELAMNFIMFFCLFDFTAYFSWGEGGVFLI